MSESVDPDTGEITTLPAVLDAAPTAVSDPFAGIGTLVLTETERAQLAAEIPAEKILILPTGEVYLPQVSYRRILNDVIGAGQWGLRRLTAPEETDGTVFAMWALIIRGHFVSEAPGECDYQPDNRRMSKATALEAAKSNSLTRNCKELGIASQCWDRAWAEAFKAAHCVKVWRTGQGPGSAYKAGFQWRRTDQEPFPDEQAPDAQNRPRNDERPQQAPRGAQSQNAAPRGSGSGLDPVRGKLVVEVTALCEKYATAAGMSADDAIAEISGFDVADHVSGLLRRKEIPNIAALSDPQKVSIKWLEACKRRATTMLADLERDGADDAREPQDDFLPPEE